MKLFKVAHGLGKVGQHCPRDKKKRPAILHYGNVDQTELFRLTLVLDQTFLLTLV